MLCVFNVACYAVLRAQSMGARPASGGSESKVRSVRAVVT